MRGCGGGCLVSLCLAFELRMPAEGCDRAGSFVGQCGTVFVVHAYVRGQLRKNMARRWFRRTPDSRAYAGEYLGAGSGTTLSADGFAEARVPGRRRGVRPDQDVAGEIDGCAGDGDVRRGIFYSWDLRRTPEKVFFFLRAIFAVTKTGGSHVVSPCERVGHRLQGRLAVKMCIRSRMTISGD